MESGNRRLGGTRWLGGVGRRLVQTAGQVLFPHFCLACNTEGRLLCQQCENQYALQKGILFSLNRDQVISCFSVGRYADPILRSLLHLYKYERVQEAGEILVSIFVQVASQHLTDILPADDEPVVVPMPMHPFNQAMRGFNQSEQLAQLLAADFELELDKKTLRRKYTWRSQANITKPEERRKNIAGAFKVSDDRLFGRSVLLIDDVLTSGATVLECAAVLQQAGVKSMAVVTVLKGWGKRL